MVGVLASVAMHSLVFLSLGFVAPYDFDFEIALPNEVEFGLTEAVEMAHVADSRRAAPVAARAETGAETEAEAEAEPDAGTEAEAEAETEAEAEAETEAETETDEALIAEPTIEGPSRIPAGAHLALRIDMARIRRSPLSADVNRFLAAVPDWQLLLDGSGIDPVSDLDRLLIATPNLQRAKLVLAGRHRRGAKFTEQRVKTLAKTRGKSARWTTKRGVRTARWHNLDATLRTIAVLGPKHFAITRPGDLPRVLALAKARENRNAKREGLEEARGADSLLSMGPDEALSLEIEGVHRFIVGNVQHVPERLRIAVRETDANEATVDALATYASIAEATAAVAFWKRVRDHYAQQPVIHLMSLGSVLTRMEIRVDSERLRMSTKLNAHQIRMILSYIEGALVGSSLEQSPPSRPTQPSTIRPRRNVK